MKTHNSMATTAMTVFHYHKIILKYVISQYFTLEIIKFYQYTNVSFMIFFNIKILACVKVLEPSKHETLNQCWFILGQSSRRLPSIKPALAQCFVFVVVYLW